MSKIYKALARAEAERGSGPPEKRQRAADVLAAIGDPDRFIREGAACREAVDKPGNVLVFGHSVRFPNRRLICGRRRVNGVCRRPHVGDHGAIGRLGR